MNVLILEAAVTPARLTELGALAWPQWKDPVGVTSQHYDAEEKSYFLAGEALLGLPGSEPVRVAKGDLITIPAGECRWEVLSLVRRHYRSDALSPACCIV